MGIGHSALLGGKKITSRFELSGSTKLGPRWSEDFTAESQRSLREPQRVSPLCVPLRSLRVPLCGSA